MNVQRFIRLARGLDVEALQQMPTSAWATAASGAVVFVGALLGWVEVSVVGAEAVADTTQRGIGGGAGLLAIGAIVYHQWNAITQGIAVLAGAVTLYFFYDVYSAVGQLESGGMVDVSVAAGAYVSLLGALALVVLGVLGLAGLDDQVSI